MSGITFSTGWLYSKNKDLIDEFSDRYFFVEDPILLEIDEVPFEEYMAEPLLLPSNPKKGKRIIKGKVSNKKLKILISQKDATKLKVGQILRLKDLINIQILSIDLKNNIITSYYHSLELNREYSIIHWVPNDSNIKVKILNPDGVVSNGYGEINLKSIPLNTPIQFERYGFVNPIKLENDELFCYFTH
jgi:glutamyl-tRNA synthetase